MPEKKQYKNTEGLVSLKVEEEKKEETKQGIVKTQTPKSEDTIDLGMLKGPLFWQILSVLLIIGLVISLFALFSGDRLAISKEEAKQKVQEYVDLVLRENAQFASVGDANEDRGLYSIDVIFQGQTIVSYITKDGQLFFPNAVDLDKIANLPLITPPVAQEPIDNNVVIGSEEDGSNSDSTDA